MAYDTVPYVLVAASDAPQDVRNQTPDEYVCDGTADDVQIQAALDTGFPVMLSSGTFVGGNVTLPTGTRLAGQGVGITTYQLAASTDDHCIENSDSTNGNTDILIEGITFDFNGSNQSSDVHGLRFQRVTNFWAVNCEFKDAYHHNVVSITPAAGVNSRWYFINCLSTGAGQSANGDGFRPVDGFTQDYDGAVLTNCIANGNAHHGIHLGQACQAVNCQTDANENANIYLTGHHSLAHACQATNHGPSGSPSAHNITLETGEYIRVIGCYADGSGSASTDVIRTVSGSNYHAIIGNVVLNGSRDGIRVAGDNTIVGGNVTASNSSQNIRDLGSSNIVRNNVGWVTEASGTGSITSGGTTDVITHGLSVTPTVDDISITLSENPTNTPGAIWVDTITSTQFTVNCENDPGASNLDFGWRAAVL